MTGCGGLNKQISIYSESTAKDAGGGMPAVRTKIKTIWCRVMPQSKYIRALDGGDKSIERKIFRIRYDAVIVSGVVLKYEPSAGDENWYKVKGIDDLDDAGLLMDLTAEKIGEGEQ